jgi:hypothetical protein
MPYWISTSTVLHIAVISFCHSDVINRMPNNEEQVFYKWHHSYNVFSTTVLQYNSMYAMIFWFQLYIHIYIYVYIEGAKKMYTHFKRCYLCITFQSWIELQWMYSSTFASPCDRQDSQTWLVWIFCYRYTLSITILIHFSLS